MTIEKQHAVTPMPVRCGAMWIADELVEIKILERRLSQRLHSGEPQDNQLLRNRIQHLNQRVAVLDRALDAWIALKVA